MLLAELAIGIKSSRPHHSPSAPSRRQAGTSINLDRSYYINLALTGYYPLPSEVWVISFLITVRNGNGENAAALPIVLPQSVMDRFAMEVEWLSKVRTR